MCPNQDVQHKMFSIVCFYFCEIFRMDQPIETQNVVARARDDRTKRNILVGTGLILLMMKYF